MRSSYYSPFPREKTNNQVLKQSYTYCPDGRNKYIDIPPTVTASYMKKNPFYFDLKHQRKGMSSTRPQTSTKPNSTVSNKKKGIVFDTKTLNKLLNSNNKKYIEPKPLLNPGCEKITNLNPSSVKLHHLTDITSAEAIKILNKIKMPNPETYGKVPKYINEFKLREFIEKEYERLIDEERNYPKGTFRVWEKDRIFILNNLYIIKEDLMKNLCLFPVDYYLRSIKIKQAKANIEKRLDEIDYAIRIFELTNVFLKE